MRKEDKLLSGLWQLANWVQHRPTFMHFCRFPYMQINSHRGPFTSLCSFQPPSQFELDIKEWFAVILGPAVVLVLSKVLPLPGHKHHFLPFQAIRFVPCPCLPILYLPTPYFASSFARCTYARHYLLLVCIGKREYGSAIGDTTSSKSVVSCWLSLLGVLLLN